ncbi:hypothetical protein Pmar_PMAR014086 [Perkinsus marinus ATCC 50983]|uniref:DUF4455 domain-containing protein n=1 Tax=Perkinsus marinus (strain ATCC 50983 / TXsc) TaxID=423536 RepID=C5L2U8_PERM5|nr:hypothetical protein Pmar_PMAR014086 [Perkinsus marinus ATCC 50983]EER08921.1 hypothetical protein Pmar_PMAR014086 [Perkinsus marinus ATCC 50983]|eukprot:XP_002777105.1 hypothetical protein Pmar_PMAR014086 [Perkinsus marinus ATCC 50983]
MVRITSTFWYTCSGGAFSSSGETHDFRLDKKTNGTMEEWDIEVTLRKDRIDKRLRSLTEELLLAAHADEGSVQRIIADLATEANAILADNRREHVDLLHNLRILKCNDERISLVERWERGRHRWRMSRHDQAMHRALKRLRSSEFQDPPELVTVFESLKESQADVLARRLETLAEIRDSTVGELTGDRAQAALASLDELSAGAAKNYATQREAMDMIRKHIGDVGQKLYEHLVAEIEQIDCRARWGEHSTAAEVVDAVFVSDLQACYSQLDALISTTKERLDELEREQHTRCSKMAALIMSTSVALEDMRSQKLTMMEQHKNDLQRRRAEHEAECEAKEEKLKECRRRIRSSPHIDPDLEEATTETYTQLDAMAAEIENFAKKMLHVHEEYPSSVERLTIAMQRRAAPNDEKDHTGTDVVTHPATKEHDDDNREPEQLLELWSGVAAASMCELLDPQHFVEERICQREELDEPVADPLVDGSTSGSPDEALTKGDGVDQSNADGNAEIAEASCAGVLEQTDSKL